MNNLTIQTCLYSVNFGKEISYVGSLLGTNKIRQRIKQILKDSTIVVESTRELTEFIQQLFTVLGAENT